MPVNARSEKRNVVYATTLNNLAAVALATGRYPEAERFLREVLAVYERTDGKESVVYLTGLNNLAAVHYMTGQYEQAARYYAEALAIIGRVLGTGHPDWARTSKNLARAREKSGHRGKGEER